jgi:predicted Fe-Mo cluster-binding NifX family protein
MLIAATYENGQIFQHFGRTPMFKVYEIENGMVTRTGLLDPDGAGHGALVGVLMECGIEALICGGIGPGAVNFLAQAGIAVYAGNSGSADEAAVAFAAGELAQNSDANCDHHDHEHGEGCGHHGEGEHHCCH